MRTCFIVAGCFMAGAARGAPAAGPTTAPAHAFRSQVKVEVTDDLLVVHSNGIPDHSTGAFPNRSNPNSIREQNYTFKIPRKPVFSKTITKTPMGPIGVAVNGVPFYNPYNAEGADAALNEVFDDCCGHPDPAGRYHYHIYPKCVHTSFKDETGRHSSLIGYAFDGFAIYGPNGDGGKRPTDLDECNGHADAERGYHYHVTNKFPYIVGGYHGVVDQGNFDGRQGGGPRGGPMAAMRGGPAGGQGAPGFHLLPPFAMEALKLTSEQQAQLTALEGEVRERLKAILTAEQMKQVEEARPPGRGGAGGRAQGR